MRGASASTTTCRRSCRWRSAPARRRCCAWSPAYAVFANGGRSISPTLIDRIQDRFGETIFRHDERVCEGCAADAWQGQDEPAVVDNREQVLDPMTAYQMTSMLRGRGPARHGDGGPGARQAGRRQDRHHQRLSRRLVRRLLARPRGRRLHRLRQAAPAGPRRDRRPARGADLHRVHEDGAGRHSRRSRSACRRA